MHYTRIASNEGLSPNAAFPEGAQREWHSGWKSGVHFNHDPKAKKNLAADLFYGKVWCLPMLGEIKT